MIGTRLKGRASEWFHSKPEHVEMTSDVLLDELRGMFYHRPNKIVMRRRFEERMWKKNETFHDYVHEKTIMANRIAIPDGEILDYIIDGIPDPNLRDLARIHGFTTRDQILQAFDEISLQGRVYPTTTTSSKSEDKGGGVKSNPGKGSKDVLGNKCAPGDDKDVREKKDRVTLKRCFNCGLRDHVSLNCPLKEKGVKCFGCNEYGHIAAKCPKKETTKSSCAITQPQGHKHPKEVLINDVAIQAIIDNGSDITIMREDEYIKLGSPRIELEVTPFRGIGMEENRTNGGFYASLTVDGNNYVIPIHVVADQLSRYKLLIGSDFLDTVDVELKRGKPTIIKPDYRDDGFAEICQISVISDSVINAVDVTNIPNDRCYQTVKQMIENYKPNPTSGRRRCNASYLLCEW
ncbi:uncharacterized protein LOC107271021 [Cephus cinctus]|uniref:Uncharacterized protein LOC107271021 n=1 Tax=Cephus cinctus TaxID=211228 RepID=A0AAJ7C565_CEPCN|nr:uncharacterized protein LOC107271021 [Cephus cinctus]